MTLLLDQGLPRSTVFHLRAVGIESIHVGERGLATASDASILDVARRENLIVVTLDADFHALLALSVAASPSVIRIRIEGLRGEQIANMLVDVLSLCEKDLAIGAVVSVTENGARIRRLPLVR
ncbi:MAG: DUF5615 family PIN-like protein [Candidatus Acidiferrum sp.]